MRFAATEMRFQKSEDGQTMACPSLSSIVTRSAHENRLLEWFIIRFVKTLIKYRMDIPLSPMALYTLNSTLYAYSFRPPLKLYLELLPFLLFLPSKLAASFCTSSRASPALRLLDAFFDLTLTVVLLPLRPPDF